MTPQAVGFGNTASQQHGDGPSDMLALWHFGLARSATLSIGGGSRAARRNPARALGGASQVFRTLRRGADNSARHFRMWLCTRWTLDFMEK